MEKQARKKPGPKPKPIPIEKTCVECAETKPYAEFPLHRNSCKVCVSKYAKALYSLRKEARKASRDMAKGL